MAQVTSWGVEWGNFTLVRNGTCMKGLEKQGRVHR
jgi:hypothetical protein